MSNGLIASIYRDLYLRRPLAARLVAIGGNVQRLKQLHRAAVQVPDLEAFRRLLVEAAD